MFWVKPVFYVMSPLKNMQYLLLHALGTTVSALSTIALWCFSCCFLRRLCSARLFDGAMVLFTPLTFVGVHVWAFVSVVGGNVPPASLGLWAHVVAHTVITAVIVHAVTYNQCYVLSIVGAPLLTALASAALALPVDRFLAVHVCAAFVFLGSRILAVRADSGGALQCSTRTRGYVGLVCLSTVLWFGTFISIFVESPTDEWLRLGVEFFFDGLLLPISATFAARATSMGRVSKTQHVSIRPKRRQVATVRPQPPPPPSEPQPLPPTLPTWNENEIGELSSVPTYHRGPNDPPVTFAGITAQPQQRLNPFQ